MGVKKKLSERSRLDSVQMIMDKIELKINAIQIKKSDYEK